MLQTITLVLLYKVFFRLAFVVVVAVQCPLLNLLIKPILNGIIKAFYLFDRREL